MPYSLKCRQEPGDLANGNMFGYLVDYLASVYFSQTRKKNQYNTFTAIMACNAMELAIQLSDYKKFKLVKLFQLSKIFILFLKIFKSLIKTKMHI